MVALYRHHLGVQASARAGMNADPVLDALPTTPNAEKAAAALGVSRRTVEGNGWLDIASVNARAALARPSAASAKRLREIGEKRN
jgi:hypothetical protein